MARKRYTEEYKQEYKQEYKHHLLELDLER